MQAIELWPWGLLIISALSVAIGWLIKDLIVKPKIKKKDEIIRAQEREYIKLAQKHVESRESDKSLLNQMEERLAALKTGEETTVVMKPSSEEDKILIEELHDELDRLKIENQKISAVPTAMYIEKNKALKTEVKQLKKRIKSIAEVDQKLGVENKRLKKKLKKHKKARRREVRIVETIDFKKLKKLLKDLPVKRSRLTIYPGDKKKKEIGKVSD